ncbi:MAG: sugar phosphate isomerase/epimerase [Clostridia bacterium]|nr:sugar phosphate isomerase/epimerase [Clostridia bacterium]
MSRSVLRKGGEIVAFIRTGSGAPIPVIVPSRYFGYRSDNLHYSLSAMADFAHEAGFDGVDLSLDTYDRFDEFLVMVLYSFRLRCDRLGLSVPMCHLPFYMPDPDDKAAMARFIREQTEALETAARLSIPTAVIHPIVRHGSTCTSSAWLRENVDYLSPLRELAAKKNVTLCLENMTGIPYPDAPGEHVWGSAPEDIAELSERLDVSVCWDFGHAHLTGLRQSASLAVIGRRLRTVHIHDNDGARDTHAVPFDGTVDWQDAMTGLRQTGFLSGGATDRCLDLELKTSDLPDDRQLRLSHAARALTAAKVLARML